MRHPDPLILGAGPAGCAAAIGLARGGAQPILLDRDENVADPLCGGFLSWRTLEQLRGLGVEAQSLGGHEVMQLRLFQGPHCTVARLPRPAMGLSRHALDTALRKAALAAGAELAFDTIRKLEGSRACGRSREWDAESIFLATGKEDVRGLSRPRQARDPALGLRVRLPATSNRTRLLAGAIELHLFDGGYAGIVLQECGSANICLALRKSALRRSGGDPVRLLADLAATNAPLAARLGENFGTVRTDTIGAVPYGWIARDTEPGLFRLGDQAAVIPSLAGEGIGLALASGAMAAQHWLAAGAGAASAYQHTFAGAAHRPVQLARLARRLAETASAARVMLALTRMVPQLLTLLADATRIEPQRSLA